jgi:hypothetical protein
MYRERGNISIYIERERGREQCIERERENNVSI